MARKPSPGKAAPKEATQEIGISSGRGGRIAETMFYADDFLPQLRGDRAIRKYREMRDNDPIIGAILTAMDMMLRAVEWRVEPADDTPQAAQEAEFVEGVLHDMSGTWEEFISEVLSFLPFGFSFFEVVYKQRLGPHQSDSAKRSRFSDGRIGIRKLAPRAQWTIERFVLDDKGGIEAVVQNIYDATGSKVIPIDKGLLFRTVTLNNNPTGRSVLRNCYLSYHYATHITEIEAIAIERELNGLPVGRMPSEYLAPNASAQQVAIRNIIEKALRDVKFNEQGYLLLPSDMITDADGKPTNTPMVGFELMASNGTRAIDTSAVITRHQQDMARSVMADFIMLGATDKGSFALSKSKTDLFLRALEGYLSNIAAVINRHLVPKLWALNALPMETMPTVVPGEVAPVDIVELGEYIQRLSGSGVQLFPDQELENVLRSAAGLPEADIDMDLLGRPQQEEREDDENDGDQGA